MINFPLDIPDDPVAIYVDPAFKQARMVLHQYVRNVDDEEIIDDTEFMMFQETGPEHIFPELGESECEEKNGKIEIHIRAPYCEETMIILPNQETDMFTVLDVNIGPERSDAMISALAKEERIALVQFAFAERYSFLRRKMDTYRQKLKPVSTLANRIVQLYGTYERRMSELLATD